MISDSRSAIFARATALQQTPRRKQSSTLFWRTCSMNVRTHLLAACAALATFSAAHAQLAASAPAAMPATPAPAPAAAPAPASAPAPVITPAPGAERKVMITAPAAASGDANEGKVAHYGAKFNGRKTASGEVFNSNAMTMAHKTLPFGTRVKVTNLANKKSVVVRVNDRGPTNPDRIGDLTTGAARKIGMTKAGVVDARLEVVGQAKAGKKK
jgi:rare lipoprotein A